MKYLSEKETLRKIDILSDVTYSYNNSMHRIAISINGF